jgi:hypothetical protein
MLQVNWTNPAYAVGRKKQFFMGFSSNASEYSTYTATNTTLMGIPKPLPSIAMKHEPWGRLKEDEPDIIAGAFDFLAYQEDWWSITSANPLKDAEGTYLTDAADTMSPYYQYSHVFGALPTDTEAIAAFTVEDTLWGSGGEVTMQTGPNFDRAVAYLCSVQVQMSCADHNLSAVKIDMSDFLATQSSIRTTSSTSTTFQDNYLHILLDPTQIVQTFDFGSMPLGPLIQTGEVTVNVIPEFYPSFGHRLLGMHPGECNLDKRSQIPPNFSNTPRGGGGEVDVGESFLYDPVTSTRSILPNGTVLRVLVNLSLRF